MVKCMSVFNLSTCFAALAISTSLSFGSVFHVGFSILKENYYYNFITLQMYCYNFKPSLIAVWSVCLCEHGSSDVCLPCAW